MLHQHMWLVFLEVLITLCMAMQPDHNIFRVYSLHCGYNYAKRQIGGFGKSPCGLLGVLYHARDSPLHAQLILASHSTLCE